MRTLLLCLLLAACSDRPSDEARAARRAKREAAASAQSSQPPAIKEHALANGALVVLDVPVADGYGGIDRQKCFVWREPGIASMSCPNRDVVLAP